MNDKWWNEEMEALNTWWKVCTAQKVNDEINAAIYKSMKGIQGASSAAEAILRLRHRRAVRACPSPICGRRARLSLSLSLSSLSHLSVSLLLSLCLSLSLISVSLSSLFYPLTTLSFSHLSLSLSLYHLSFLSRFLSFFSLFLSLISLSPLSLIS
jgi:hypothetical protein